MVINIYFIFNMYKLSKNGENKSGNWTKFL